MDRKALRALENAAIERARAQAKANRLRDKGMLADAKAARAEVAANRVAWKETAQTAGAYAAERKALEDSADQAAYARLGGV